MKNNLDTQVSYKCNKCSDKTFILKNRSLYETKEDGDIVLKKDIDYAIPWDVPKRLVNEFKSC